MVRETGVQIELQFGNVGLAFCWQYRKPKDRDKSIPVTKTLIVASEM